MFRMRRCSPTFLKLTTICDVSHVISSTRPSSPLFFPTREEGLGTRLPLGVIATNHTSMYHAHAKEGSSTLVQALFRSHVPGVCDFELVEVRGSFVFPLLDGSKTSWYLYMT